MFDKVCYHVVRIADLKHTFLPFQSLILVGVQKSTSDYKSNNPENS